jgi:hypothetical protein
VAGPPQTEQRAPGDWIERAFPLDELGQPITTGFTVLGRASEGGHERVRPWMERMLSESLLQRAPLALVASKVVGTRTASSAIGEVLADRLESSGDASVAQALESVGVPDQTVSLRRVAEWISRTLLSAMPQSEEEHALAERARHFNNLGARLNSLGRGEEALDALTEAVNKLWPFFEALPAAFADHTYKMLMSTQRLHKALQLPPSPVLDERVASASGRALTHFWVFRIRIRAELSVFRSASPLNAPCHISR